MDGGMACVKYLIFIFNFLFWVSGLAIIVVGSLIYVQLDRYGDALNDNFGAGVILLIVVGCIVTLIAFFGCCGACKENHCMIITFSVFLGIIFVLELAAGITCYVYRTEIDNIAGDQFNLTWSKYGTDDEARKTVDFIQHDLKCCGVDGPDDWTHIPWKRETSPYPPTCCDNVPTGNTCSKSSVDFHNDGCYKKLKSRLENNILIVAGVGVGVAFIQLIGIAFACCLASTIRKNYEVV